MERTQPVLRTLLRCPRQPPPSLSSSRSPQAPPWYVLRMSLQTPQDLTPELDSSPPNLLLILVNGTDIHLTARARDRRVLLILLSSSRQPARLVGCLCCLSSPPVSSALLPNSGLSHQDPCLGHRAPFCVVSCTQLCPYEH